MRKTVVLALCLFFLTSFGTIRALAKDGDGGISATRKEVLKYANNHGRGQIGQIYTGDAGASAKAATDTFYLYGGPPNYPEGTFEGSGKAPGDVYGWTPTSLSNSHVYWHGSTIHADASIVGLSDSLFLGTGTNQCVISHHQKTSPTGWSGYGNNWDDQLVFRVQLQPADAAAMSTVQLTAEYKCDLENCCDYLMFEYETTSGWHTIAALDVSTYGNFDPNNPGTNLFKARLFDSNAPSHDGLSGGITYQTTDYVGANNDEIALRIRVVSDSSWSDEGGRPSGGGTYPRGGAYLDNIHVYLNGNQISFADWEGATIIDQPEGTITGLNKGAGSYPKAASGTISGWVPTPARYNGDFCNIISSFVEGDLDPTAEDNSAMLSFINEGQGAIDDPLGPNNASGVPPAVGSTTYGIPGGYVFEYQGGLLDAGEGGVYNKWISPSIAVDQGLPSTNGGFAMGFSLWADLPLSNYIFWRWSVRSHDPVAGGWTPWRDSPYHYYSETPAWENPVIDISSEVASGADSVQIGLMGRDAAVAFTGSPSMDATPGPEYDNVYLKRFDIYGPVITVPANDLFNDAFPPDGTRTSPVRFDPAGNIGGMGKGTTVYVPKDSLAVNVKAVIPGTSLADFGTMHVAQLENPYFDSSVRSAGKALVGATPTAAVVDAAHTGWACSTYDIAGHQSTANNLPVSDTYFFDLPDGPGYGLYGHADEEGLIYPGDVVHYYLEFSDDQPTPEVSRTVEDISVFLDFRQSTTWPRQWTMRALPTVISEFEQPGAIWWNDAGHSEGEEAMLLAFAQNGMLEGRDFDTYTTKGASSGLGNGLGSAGEHGATLFQMDGYDCLFYTLGTLSEPALSDGNKGVNGNDWSDDLSLVTSWHNQDADRFSVYFGEDFAQAMANQQHGAFLANILGVDFVGGDMNASHNLDDQVAPVVRPTGNYPSFVTIFSPYGGPPGINDWDILAAHSGAVVVGHEFTQRNGNFYATPRVASIVFDRLESGNRKVDITFPFDPFFVRDEFTNPESTGPIAARAYLLGDILNAFGKVGGGPPTSGQELPSKLWVEQNYPNPFNPSTTIKYSLPSRQQVEIGVYNLRGACIVNLVDGVQETGEHSVIWNGKDSHGTQVSSGLYLYKVRTEDAEIVKKMALIK